MSVNDTSWSLIDDSRVVLQIVASLIGNSRGIIYAHNMFIVQATGVILIKLSFLRHWRRGKKAYVYPRKAFTANILA